MVRDPPERRAEVVVEFKNLLKERADYVVSDAYFNLFLDMSELEDHAFTNTLEGIGTEVFEAMRCNDWCPNDMNAISAVICRYVRHDPTVQVLREVYAQRASSGYRDRNEPIQIRLWLARAYEPVVALFQTPIMRDQAQLDRLTSTASDTFDIYATDTPGTIGPYDVLHAIMRAGGPSFRLHGLGYVFRSYKHDEDCAIVMWSLLAFRMPRELLRICASYLMCNNALNTLLVSFSYTYSYRCENGCT